MRANNEQPIIIISGDGSEAYCAQTRLFLNSLQMGEVFDLEAVDKLSVRLCVANVDNDAGIQVTLERYFSNQTLPADVIDLHSDIDLERLFIRLADVGFESGELPVFCLDVDMQEECFDFTELRHLIPFWLMFGERCYVHIALDNETDYAKVSEYLCAYVMTTFESTILFEKARTAQYGGWVLVGDQRSQSMFLRHLIISLEEDVNVANPENTMGLEANAVFRKRKIKPINLRYLFKWGRLSPLLILDWNIYRLLATPISFAGGIGLLNAQDGGREQAWSTLFDIVIGGPRLGASADDTYELLQKLILHEMCQSHLRSVKSIDLLSSEDIQNELARLSGLGAIIFSSLFGYGEKLIERQVKDLILSSETMATGVLQLVENALEHGGGGTLSIRVYRKRSELAEKYYRLAGFWSESEVPQLVEVLVDDWLGEYSLTQSFNEITSSKTIPEDNFTLKKQLAELAIEDFFSPSKSSIELWERYYGIGTNYASHYGLQVFASVVNSLHGSMSVSSCSVDGFHEGYTENVSDDERGVKLLYGEASDLCTLPGTHYRVVLPAGARQNPLSTGVDAAPDLNDRALLEEWAVRSTKVSKLYDLSGVLPHDLRQVKDNLINKNADFLKSQLCENKIFCYRFGSHLDAFAVEMFAKGLFVALASAATQASAYRIALVDVPPSTMEYLTRYLVTFYNRQGDFKAMGNSEVYIVDAELKTELVFRESIADSYQVSESIASFKGEFNACLEIMRVVWRATDKKHPKGRGSLKFAPFDLLVRSEENNSTLFEQKARKALKSPIQEAPFGCRLPRVHMHAGSKMHVTDAFYEGSLLFSSNQYNTRFAYLMAQEVKEALEERFGERPPQGWKCNLVIIGYETYSELLVVETRNLLNAWKACKTCDYAIYEQGDFKFLSHEGSTDSLLREKAGKGNRYPVLYVILVPINTTFTTHSKIISDLKGYIKPVSPDVLVNLGPVLIRDLTTEGSEDNTASRTDAKMSKLEGKYWKKIDLEKRVVEPRDKLVKEIRFNVVVSNNWADPLDCKACFPEDDFENETPLVSASRDSVVPMVQFGPIYQNDKRTETQKTRAAEKHKGDVSLLRDSLRYGHLCRHHNHFLYYIDTAYLMRTLRVAAKSGKTELEKWLNGVGRQISKEQDKSKAYEYNVIVAPLHESNAEFVEYVNEHVFGNSDFVLYLDVDKEYRSNTVCKYSNLTALYANLVKAQRQANINLHFVDDTIVSAGTFYRAKSLVSSLFPKEAFLQDALVHVNLFAHVFVLLNRNSDATIGGLCRDLSSFHSFIDLNIASLRNHRRNACAICSACDDYRRLRDNSATPNLYNYWENRIEGRYAQKDVGEYAAPSAKDSATYYRRMLTTHNATCVIDGLGVEREDADAVRCALLDLIEDDMRHAREGAFGDYSPVIEANEILISYLKVLSRPYLSYQKAVKAVVLKLAIQIANRLLAIESGGDDLDVNFLYSHLKDLDSKEAHDDLLSCTFAELANLGSAYLVRERVIAEVEKQSDRVQECYKHAVKKVITLQGGENRALWLQSLLLTGNENYCRSLSDGCASCEGKGSGYNASNILCETNTLRRTLFVENNRILRDAVGRLKCLTQKNHDANELLRGDSSVYFLLQEEDFGDYHFTDCKLQDSLERFVFDACPVNKSLSKRLADLAYLSNLLEADFSSLGNGESLGEGFKQDIVPFNRYEAVIEGIARITNAETAALFSVENDSNDLHDNRIYRIACWTFEKKRAEVDYEIGLIVRNDSDNHKSEFVPGIMVDNQSGRVKICIIDAKESDSVINDAIYLYLDLGGLNNLQRLVSIRDLLLVYPELRKRLMGDLQGNLFRRLRDVSRDNKLLSSAKAGHHSETSILQRIWVDFFDFGKKDFGESLAAAGYVLQLATDSLISRLYTESLNTDSDSAFSKSSASWEFNEQFAKVIESIIVDADYPKKAQLFIDDAAKRVNLFYDNNYYENIPFIVSAIILNAVKHGSCEEMEGEEYGIIKIFIYIDREADEKFLMFDNYREAGDEQNSDGITLPALKHYFKKTLDQPMIIRKQSKMLDCQSRPVFCVGIPVSEGKPERG